MISVIIDTIQDRLELLGIEITRFSGTELRFRADNILYAIWCERYHAAIHDWRATYGDFLYADPDFYVRIIKKVRMIMRPTPIWHIVQIGSFIGSPGILDE